MEDKKQFHKWLVDEEYQVEARGLTTWYKDMLDSNNNETFFRYCVQKLFLQYRVHLSSKYSWSEICSIHDKAQKILRKSGDLKPKPKNLWEHVSKKLDVSVQDLFSMVSVTSAVNSIDYFEQGKINRAFHEIIYAELFTGRAIGNRSDNSIPLPYQRIISGGVKGGKAARDIRKELRGEFTSNIKSFIDANNLWNDATNTIQSITNNLWHDVQVSVKEKGEWQGLQIDLKKSKIGRQTVYDAVSETAPN